MTLRRVRIKLGKFHLTNDPNDRNPQMRKMVAVSAAASASALLLVAGCSGTTGGTNPGPVSADPKTAVADAFTQTGQGKDSTVTFKFDTTEADVQKVFDAMNSGSSSTPNPSTQQTMKSVAKIIPLTTFKVATHSNGDSLNAEKDPNKIDANVNIAVDGKPIEFTWLASRAFLRADVQGLGQATGLFTIDQVKMYTADSARTMPWITPLVEGKWVEADSASVKQMIQKAQASAAPSASPSIDPKKAQAAILDNSEVTKVSDGTYKVVTDAKKVIPALAAIDPNDSFTDQKAQDALKQVKDGANLDSTVTIANGKVTKIDVDLADVLRTWPQSTDKTAQALAQADFKLNGVAEINEDNPNITAPQPAATIPAKDLQGLTQGR